MFVNRHLARRFNYRTPTPENALRHEEVRQAARDLAALIDSMPYTPEQAVALQKVEEAMFWANAAIARGPE
jgi:hypothetical protein